MFHRKPKLSILTTRRVESIEPVVEKPIIPTHDYDVIEVLSNTVKAPEPKPPKKQKKYLPGERLLEEICKAQKRRD